MPTAHMLKFLGRNEWYISPELYPFHKPLDVDNVVHILVIKWVCEHNRSKKIHTTLMLQLSR